MDRTFEDERLGPYRLLRPLTSTSMAERWVGLHEREQTTYVLYLFDVCHDRAEERRFIDAMEQVSRIDQAHLLPIVHYSILAGGRPWAVTPYLGSQVGLVTLESLREEKGGSMPLVEVERVLSQLLATCSEASEAGVYHGPLKAEDVLVDRSGRVSIEMYGVSRMLEGLSNTGEIARDEVRSLIELAYYLLTGLSAEEPRIPAGRLIKRLPGTWNAWIEEGLSPVGGFDSAAEALAAMPGQHGAALEVNTRSMRTVFGRVRSALGPRQG